MKKSKKALLLIGSVAVIVGSVGLSNNTYAYNHKPSNVLDNVFEKDGTRILPFIFDNSDQTVTKQFLLKEFNKAGITVENEAELKDVIGTGTLIKTKNRTYTVLVYGDVNGDGYVDVFDAQSVMRHYVHEGQYTLTGINAIAGNVNNNDDEADMFDSQRILRFHVGFEKRLVVNEPPSLKENDKEPPVIKLNGENPQKIKFGIPYVELGATATDNVDEIVKVEANASSVDINKLGTYYVSYNAQDSKGNKAIEVKREVIVEDYVKNVEITTPTKTEYEYGSKIDVSGGKLKIIYASGKTETKDITEDMVKGYDANNIAVQRVTISYKTNNTIDDKTTTFEKTYSVTVKSGPVVIKPTGVNNGEIYDTLEIAKLTVNGRFGNITAKILDIKGDKVPDEDVAITIVQESNTKATMNFRAVEPGKYTIIPVIDGVEIATATMEVKVVRNEKVNKIVIGDNEEPEMTINEGRLTQIPLAFKHVYKDGTEEDILVQVQSINENITTTGGVSYFFSDGANILETGDPEGVKFIYIEATKTVKLSIAVDGCTQTKTINVREVEKKLNVNNGNKITLHIEEPEIKQPLVKNENGVIYTLVPILVEGRVEPKLTQQEIREKIKISIGDIEDAVAENKIWTYGFIDVDNIASQDGDKVEYIGIALNSKSESDLTAIRTNGIKITYEDLPSVNLEVALKSGVTVTPTKETTIEGELYSNFEIATITSKGEIGNVTTKVLDINGDETENVVVNIEKAEYGKVIIKVQGNEAGTYTIIPVIDGIERTADVIPVKVSKNEQVNKIIIGENENAEIAGEAGRQIRIPLRFRHVYSNGKEHDVPVEAKEITVAPVQGMTYFFSDEDTVLENGDTETVKYIYITANETLTLSITVGEKTQEKTITIKEAQLGLVVNNREENIELYLEEPTTTKFITKTENGIIYTLLPISMTGRDEVKLTQEEIHDKIKIGIGNVEDAVSENKVWTYGFIDQNTMASSGNNEVEYIGIALKSKTEEDLNNIKTNGIKVTYENLPSVQLKVRIPNKIVITPVQTGDITGDINTKFKIATIKTNGESVTNITAKVLNFAGQEVTDVTIDTDPENAGEIAINAIGTKAGTYTIIPIIDGIERTGDSISLKLSKNETVNKIVIGENETVEIKGQAGEPIDIPIAFKHVYSNGKEENVDVQVDDIKVGQVQGMTYVFSDGSTELEGTDTGIRYINVTANKSFTLSITVDGKTVTKVITIEQPNYSLSVNNNRDNTTLYVEIPTQLDEGIKIREYNGVIYTLIPISVEGRPESKLTQAEIQNKVKISIGDIQDAVSANKIWTYGFIDENTPADLSTDLVTYIGIGINSKAQSDISNIKANGLSISYEDLNSVDLKVNIPTKIVVTPVAGGTLRTDIHTEYKIATVSGDVTNVNAKIKETVSGKEVTDDSVVMEAIQENGNITMYVKGKVPAKSYDIIPVINGVERTADKITVRFERNNTVTDIQIGDGTSKTITATSGELIPIAFKHVYEDGTDEEISIYVSDLEEVTITPENEIIHGLSDGENLFEDGDDGEVKYLYVEAEQESTVTFSIKINGKTETVTINVTV